MQDGSGEISYRELQKLIESNKPKYATKRSEAAIEKALAGKLGEEGAWNRVSDLLNEWNLGGHGDGMFDRAEIGRAVAMMGITGVHRDLSRLFNSFDTFGTGVIE